MKKLALHTCCAPCLIGVYPVVTSELDGEFDHVTAVFYNPNIAPEDEYVKRRDACAEYAREYDIEFVEIDPADEWQQMVAKTIAHPTCEDKSQRDLDCLICYRVRLGRTAEWAAENGHDVFATTLSISPWQNLEMINQAGIERCGIMQARHLATTFASYDFRDYYQAAQRTVRSLGVYCQNYCGCLPSKIEAEAQRAARRRMGKQKRKND